MPVPPKILHQVAPGSTVDLSSLDPRDASAAPGDRKATEKATVELQHRIAQLHDVLWAQGEHRVLIVLQGTDTAGKGGTIKALLDELNPSGFRVATFKKPTDPELARDYLWRVHQEVPADGQLVVFDRSHYEDVLIVRVKELVEEERWRRRYDHINDFERMLADEGTLIVKLFLHISKEEQQERLQSRLDEPTKRWKFLPGDLEERERWDAYEDAYQDMLDRTSTPEAPWHVIPADRKWYRNWAACTIVADALATLDLAYPPAYPGADQVTIT